MHRPVFPVAAPPCPIHPRLAGARAVMRLWLAALVLVLGGCGRFSSNDGPKEDEGDVAVGQDFDLPTTAGTQATVVTTPPPGEIVTEDTRVATNQSLYDSPEGFRLILTVEGDLKYGPGEDIKLQVLVRNISKNDMQFDPNDLRNFAFRPTGTSHTAWTDGNCRAARVPKAVEGPAQTLKPNEEATFVDTYPGPTDMANRDDCRVGGGDYTVFGFVAWCPPGSLDSRRACDASKTKQVTSAGVRISIG